MFLMHRLSRAEKVYWQHRAQFREAIGDSLKLKLWLSTVQTAAVYGLEMLHVTKSLLLKARAWEYKWLRKVFRLAKITSESSEAYAKRFARHISSIFQKLKHHVSTFEF